MGIVVVKVTCTAPNYKPPEKDKPYGTHVLVELEPGVLTEGLSGFYRWVTTQNRPNREDSLDRRHLHSNVSITVEDGDDEICGAFCLRRPTVYEAARQQMAYSGGLSRLEQASNFDDDPWLWWRHMNAKGWCWYSQTQGHTLPGIGTKYWKTFFQYACGMKSSAADDYIKTLNHQTGINPSAIREANLEASALQTEE